MFNVHLPIFAQKSSYSSYVECGLFFEKPKDVLAKGSVAINHDLEQLELDFSTKTEKGNL
mgnify:CR=1 FL=1